MYSYFVKRTILSSIKSITYKTVQQNLEEFFGDKTETSVEGIHRVKRRQNGDSELSPSGYISVLLLSMSLRFLKIKNPQSLEQCGFQRFVSWWAVLGSNQ